MGNEEEERILDSIDEIILEFLVLDVFGGVGSGR